MGGAWRWASASILPSTSRRTAWIPVFSVVESLPSRLSTVAAGWVLKTRGSTLQKRPAWRARGVSEVPLRLSQPSRRRCLRFLLRRRLGRRQRSTHPRCSRWRPGGWTWSRALRYDWCRSPDNAVVPFMQLSCTADGPLASIFCDRAIGWRRGRLDAASRGNSKGDGDVMRAVKRDWRARNAVVDK